MPATGDVTYDYAQVFICVVNMVIMSLSNLQVHVCWSPDLTWVVDVGYHSDDHLLVYQ